MLMAWASLVPKKVAAFLLDLVLYGPRVILWSAMFLLRRRVVVFAILLGHGR
jgi:hypothetical protein